MMMDLANKLRAGQVLSEQERGLLANVVALVATASYDRVPVPFIAGHVGDVGSDGLPEALLVCPAYGADQLGLYVKNEAWHDEADKRDLRENEPVIVWDGEVMAMATWLDLGDHGHWVVLAEGSEVENPFGRVTKWRRKPAPPREEAAHA